MFETKNKYALYFLIELYLKHAITARTFCDEFYYLYDLEIDLNDLNEQEQFIYDDLSIIVSRFSEFESDHKMCPNAFYTKEDLENKVREAYSKLNKNRSR